LAKYKPQHVRLLFIDKKIRSGTFPNCTSMAEEWEVSPRTIHRDIDYPRYQLDAPIDYSAGRRGYFYTEQQYKLPAMEIRESDLFSVYLAEKLLRQYEGTPVFGSLQSVFRKIEQSLPEKISSIPVDDQSKFTIIAPFSTTIEPAVWTALVNCLRASRQIEIVYRAPGKEPTARVLDPYHAVRFEGDWYVVGHCYLRNEIRTFSFSRIVSAVETGKNFKIPEYFNFKKFSGSHFGVHWGEGEIRVKVRFSKRVACYVRERKWHSSQVIAENEHGEITLTLTVNHLLELKRWILSWGAEALVLEPDYFAQDIEATLKQATNNYVI